MSAVVEPGSGSLPGLLASVNINIDAHTTAKVFGMTIDLDVVWATAIAGLLVIIMGLALRRSATSAVPGKFQIAWEFINDAVANQVRSTIGDQAAFVVPLAITLFLFILFANLLDIFAFTNGSDAGIIAAPSGSVNFTAALAVFVIVLVHITGIRRRGFKTYVGHFFQNKAMAFFEIIGEIVKPVTLALRLFGNMFTGILLLVMIGALILHNDHPSVGVIWVGGGLVFEVVWKLFDAFIGVIQAFVFALLTLIYFQFAIVGIGEDAH